MEGKENKCEAGCMVFTGGELRHDKDCVYYPESLSKMFDDLEKSYNDLWGMLNKINALMLESHIVKDRDFEREDIEIMKVLDQWKTKH